MLGTATNALEKANNVFVKARKQYEHAATLAAMEIDDANDRIINAKNQIVAAEQAKSVCKNAIEKINDITGA